MDLRLSPDDRISDARGRKAAKPATRASVAGGSRADKPAKPVKKPRDPKPKRRRRSSLASLGNVLYFFFMVGLFGAIGVGGIVIYYGAQLPAADTWAVPERPANIRVLAANGQLISNRGQMGGESVSIHELPHYVPQALIAIEDRRFYSHFGVDPIGLMAVGLESVQAGRVTRGASTLTQQLAKNLFLTPDQTLGRKVQEALLSLWLEQNYTKDDILELYLNRMYFGAGAYGIEAAAQRYFSKSSRNLSLGEAAMLAGLLQAPSRLAPTTNPEGAAARARLVLNAMAAEGYITADEARSAQIDPSQRVRQTVTGAEYYVADWVETLMTAYLGEINQDVVVQTTIDMDLQKHAESVIQNAIREFGEARNFNQAAFVAMDVDGTVRALVGGIDYSQSQYNRAVTARRQPGSAFKPFVYLAALQQGYTPDTLMIDEPLDYNGWSPQNSNNRFVGPVLLRDALAYSIKTVAARIAIDIGPENVVETAYRMGFSSNFQPVQAIALGTQEVSLLDLTAAYAPFANGGNGVIANVITRISTRDGEVLYEQSEAGPGQILTNEQVGMMNDMLSTAVDAGTGRGAQLGGWPMAGKTGTSQRSRDALFVGYTARMVGGVWLGNDDDSPTSGMAGGSVPAQIWREFMTTAHQGLSVADLPGSYVRLSDRQNNPVPVDPNQQQQQVQGQRSPDVITDVLNGIFGGN
jgi:penicillin-binding protein 1A